MTLKKQHWNDTNSLENGISISPDQLKNLQNALLEILKDVIFVCDKYKIKYFLVGGTALGAMRHGGFIPWDDDIDIAMLRPDYKRFTSCFEKELADRYYLQIPETTDGYTSLIPRIRKKGTLVRSREDLWTDNEHSGACIDMFIIENTFDNKIMRFFHGTMCIISGGILACRKTFFIRKYLRPYVIPNSKYAKKIKLRSFIGFFFSWLSINYIRKMANRCNKMCSNDNGEYVTIPSGHWRFFKETYLRKDFSKTKTILFDGAKCQISTNVEKYLSKCYNNWQSIPAEKDREQHFFCDFSLPK